ncbi:MAG: hypothetical protein CL927_06445 [Deltaproteobacteria bacterium]|nr:hypothetical protein [Deltaproteobacteria bacterium]HCH66092.1 hypothetical protein [Deltaproteobacteria bacterium]
MRALFLGIALFFSVDAYACPMADAAAYQAAKQEVSASDGAKLAFKVDGMSCGDCSTKVTTALKGIDGVKAAAVDYQTGETVVSIDASKTSADALVKAIADLGYTAQKTAAKG